MAEHTYKKILAQSPIGYAYFQILCDGNGLPVDYQFIDLNPAYESMMGLKSNDVAGKRASEVWPNLREQEVDWVTFYGEVALNGGTQEFEQFFEQQNKWYKVNVSSPQEYYFVIYLTDITMQMKMLEDQATINTFFNDIVVEFDEDLRYVNYRANDKFAYQQKNKVIGKTVRELYGEEFAAQLASLCKKARESGQIEHWVHKSPLAGLNKWFRASVVFTTDCCNQKKYILVSSDITEKIEAEQAIFAEKERLRVTLHSIGDAVLSTDRSGRIERLNPVAEQLTGWTEQEAKGRHSREVFKIINEYTRIECEDPVKKVLKTGKIIGLANHTVLIARDGTERPIADSAAPIKDEAGTVYGVILVFRDVTDEKLKQAEIEYLSYHDSLTGLYNRRFFEEELKRLDVERNLPISLIIGDVNGLKLINDVFGHLVGDILLQKAAETLRLACREDDIIARWGGDEFVVILPKTSGDDAVKLIDRIKEKCGEVEIESLKLSVSFGHQTKSKPEECILELLKNAESIMYQNKLYESQGMKRKAVEMILANLLNKDEREAKHAQRVAAISKEMARAMGLTEAQVNEMAMIGMIHDIGKAIIGKSILKKPGALTEDEWSEIKRHPEIGYRILTSSKDTVEIARYILAHHEHFDGTGYPAGIKGEAIPLQARILAIADAYVAMTSDRAYRQSFPGSYAVDVLRNNAGTQFDPLLVELFIEKVLPKVEPA